jgi:hypothetical protein
MADRGARRQTEVDQTDDAVQNAQPGPSVAKRKRTDDALQNAQPGPRATSLNGSHGILEEFEVAK